MADKSQGREFSRSPVHVRTEVRLTTGVLVEGQARNVSLNGLLFATERALPMGHTVKVSLILDTGAGEQRIETNGRVARLEEAGVAIAFDQVDAGSLDHLRQLVLYNADDSEQVEREFDAHVGLRRRF